MEVTAHARHRAWLALGVIVVLGFLVRLPGQIYPVTLHYDEGAEAYSVLCRVVPTGALYHPFLSRHLLSVPENAICAMAKVRGAERPVVQTLAKFELDPMPFVQWGRAFALLFGLGTIVAIYVLGERLAGTAVGLTAALILALTPAHVVVSNNLRPWALASLLTTCLLIALLSATKPGSSRKTLIAVGALSGLVVSTVYTLALLGIPVLLVLLTRWLGRWRAGTKTRWLSELLVVALAAVVAHLATNFVGIYGLVRSMGADLSSEFLQPTHSMFSGTAGGAEASTGFGYWQNVAWYFDALFDPLGLGVVVASAGLIGLVIAVRRGGTIGFALLASVAAFLLVQPLAVVLMAIRYTVPAMPALIVAAAWLAVTLAKSATERWPRSAKLRPAFVLAIAMTLPGLLATLSYHRALALTPTRVLAKEWIEANVPAGSAVVQNIRYISPVLRDCAAARAAGEEPNGCYDVHFMPKGALPSEELDYLENSDASFLVYTSATPVGTMERLHSTDGTAELQRRYSRVARFYREELEARFHDDTSTVNPLIEIYRLAPR